MTKALKNYYYNTTKIYKWLLRPSVHFNIISPMKAMKVLVKEYPEIFLNDYYTSIPKEICFVLPEQRKKKQILWKPEKETFMLFPQHKVISPSFSTGPKNCIETKVEIINVWEAPYKNINDPIKTRFLED